MKEMKTRERVDDDGDDYGSRVDRVPSSIVVVAVVVHRKGRKTGEKAERLLTPYQEED